MANNKIEIYQKNTIAISCAVSGLITTGYDAYLTIKQKANDDYIIQSTGTIQDASTAIFYLSSTDTSIATGDYIYDITIQKDTSIFTIIKDRFTIIDGIRY